MRTTIATLVAMQLVPILSAATNTLVAKSAFVKGTEIYVITSGSSQARQITNDGLRKAYVVLSNDGRRIAFARETRLNELSNIVVMQPDGAIALEIHFRPADANISGMRFVEGLRWITDQRLAAYGGVNPSTVEYAIVDLATGKEVDGYLVDGFAFAPSPDGSHVAYAGCIPHFTPEADHRPQFCLDHECGLDTPLGGYPPQNRHVEFTNKPVWSPDGTKVAITAEDYTTKAQSVIVRQVGGKTAEFAAPPEAGDGLHFSWQDDTIDITTANGEWKLQPGTSVWFPMK